MGRLYCIIGKSGCGKDTVFKRLLEDKSLGLLPVVTYTTRPRRDGETNGVEYHFITERELRDFESAGQVIELRRYDTVKGIWYYCTVDDGQIDVAQNNYLLIATLEGLLGLKKRFSDAVVPLYLDVEDGERLTRALLRERSQVRPNYRELCRRYLADCEDFSKARLEEAGITTVFQNDRLDISIQTIKKYILEQ